MKHQSYISVPLFFLMVSSLVIARVSIASNITYVDSADQKSFSSEFQIMMYSFWGRVLN